MSRDRLIEDKIIKTGKVNWRRFKFLQKESFKEITKKQMDKLKASILNNDFIESFKVWGHDGKIYCLDGYHRCLALSELAAEGYQVPDEFTANFIQCKDMKDAAKKVLVYSSIYASVTDEGLYEFSHDFNLNFDDIKFEIDIPKLDLDRYEAGYVRDDGYNEEEDNAPEPPAEPTAKVGDLYLLGGRHRLLCGDSTDKSNLDKLLSGSSIDLVLTDPPYGINIVKVDGATDGGSKPVTIKGSVRARNPYPFGGVKNKATGTVGARNWVDAREYYPIYGDDKPYDPTWMLQSFSCPLILFGGNYYASKLPDSRCWVVWDKNNTGHFADCELAWTSFDKGCKLYSYTWNGLVREGNRDEELTNRVHPTQKPVGLFKQILTDFSEEGHKIWDGYGGSGTTLIACEQTNRTCYMSEISPHYCDVIIERYKNLTGKDVELIESVGRVANE